MVTADGTSTETHTAKATATATVTTMSEWFDAGAPTGDIWVFDTDGWAYYAAPIEQGTASGLLIDKINIVSNPSEEWYYAVDVTAQLATAGDWGKADDAETESSMYASTMSENGVYVLNKAAGIATVSNMVITNNGKALTSDDTLLSTTSITLDVEMDVINGLGKDYETDVTWTIAKVRDLSDTATYASTLEASSSDNKVIFKATEDMVTVAPGYVITATSDLDRSQSVSITMTSGDTLLNISGFSAERTLSSTIATEIAGITALSTDTVTIDGVEWYVLEKASKINAEGQSFNGAFLYMKEPLKTNDTYKAFVFQDVAVDEYDLSSWKASDLRAILASKLSDYPTVAAAVQSMDTTMQGYTSRKAETTYDKFYPLSEAEFEEYSLSGTDIAGDTAGDVDDDFGVRWLRSPNLASRVNSVFSTYASVSSTTCTLSASVRPALWVAL